MATTFEQLTRASDDVIQTAQELIQLHHPELADVRIVFFHRSDPAVSAGKLAYAGTQKTTPLMRAVTEDADFIIWVSAVDWSNHSQAWREAILDHQLCHCGVDDGGDTTKYYLRPHDIEEFTAVIKRHGSYTVDITQTDAAIETAKTNQLFFHFNELKAALDKSARGRAYTMSIATHAADEGEEQTEEAE